LSSSVRTAPFLAAREFRWPALLILLIAECVAASLLITDGEVLISQVDDPVISLLGRAVRAAIVGLPVLLLILCRRADAVLQELKDPHPDERRARAWIAANLLAFASLWIVVWPVTRLPAGAFQASAGWVCAWAGLAAIGVACLLFAAAPPRRWGRLARREWRPILISAIAGYLIRRLSVETPQIWQTQAWDAMSEATLRATHSLLGLIYPNLVHYPPDILSTDDFTIQIFGPCSGVEGMALMAVFGGTYLLLFRKSLQFPKALLLIPLGMAAMWIANVLRITTLFVVGSSISHQLATHSFHSYAGWVGFTVIALGLIGLSHHTLLRLETRTEPPAAVAGRRLAFALLVPLATMLGTSMLVAAVSSGYVGLYPFVAIPTGLALWYYRRQYGSLLGRPSWQALGIGTIVFLIWLMLESPAAGNDEKISAWLAQLPIGWAAVWISIRVIGSVVVLPIAEELAFRGYLIRKLVSRNFETVTPGHFTWLSFVVTSILFGALHDRWLAGMIAGAAFAIALYHRGQLRDAIAAHITANALIALWVLASGRWSLWA
jgi:exosortase E/protease (VPEID-CTERM system)